MSDTAELPPPPYAAVKQAAGSWAESFCKRHIPAGKRTGEWWVASVPWRQDKNPSLIVSLTTGHWEDRGRGDRGDLTDLLARLDRCSLPEAARSLATMMGLA